MKNLRIVLFVLSVIVVSCNGLQTEDSCKILSFIPGAYVRSFLGEYSKGHDTLIINQPDEKNNYYIIKHNSSFQKIRNGRVQPIEYKSETWTAIYNKKDHIMTEQTRGKLISFLPEQNALLLGSSGFEKIK